MNNPLKPRLWVVKIGGHVLDQSELQENVLNSLAACRDQVMLIHGGGNLASSLAEKLNIPQTMVEGRRITNDETLDIALMVYAGLLNKKMVAALQQRNRNAIGLTGADGNSILAEKRPIKDIDYGWVGDVRPEGVNPSFLLSLLAKGLLPVFSAITHDGKGHLLNTNADTLAQLLAVSLSPYREVNLVYLFEKKGVLADVADENSLIPEIRCGQIEEWIGKGILTEGMIPKIRNAAAAVDAGVHSVQIGHAGSLSEILQQKDHACTLIRK